MLTRFAFKKSWQEYNTEGAKGCAAPWYQPGGLGRERLAAAAMIIGELGVGGGDGRDLGGDALEIPAGHGNVELLITQAGINTVADTSGAGNGALRKRGGNRHTGGAAEHGQLSGDTGA